MKRAAHCVSIAPQPIRGLFLNAVLAVAACSVTSHDVAHGDELEGVVAQVEDATIIVQVSGSLIPVAGDRLRIILKVPGTEILADVAQGKIVEVKGNRVVGQIEQATGRVVVEQRVLIDSPRPAERPKEVAGEEPTTDDPGDLDSSVKQTPQPIVDGAVETPEGSDEGSSDESSDDRLAVARQLFRDAQLLATIDPLLADRQMRAAADLGHVPAMLRLSELLEADGQFEEAVRWFRKAAENGSPRAAAHLGRLYRDGKGVGKDNVQSVRWLRQAVAADDPVGQLHLAYAYAFGWGVTKDMRTAREWFLKSARQGNSEAQFKYGLMAYNGWTVKQNYKTAYGWMKLSASHGNADAMNAIGNMYTDGHGVSRDYKTAIDWYQKAIRAGSKEAYYNLGQRYLRGQGVAMDKKRARELFLEAAQRGNAQGHYMYAWSLEQTTDRDNLPEAKWREMVEYHYLKALDLGEARARQALIVFRQR